MPRLGGRQDEWHVFSVTKNKWSGGGTFAADIKGLDTEKKTNEEEIRKIDKEIDIITKNLKLPNDTLCSILDPDMYIGPIASDTRLRTKLV